MHLKKFTNFAGNWILVRDAYDFLDGGQVLLSNVLLTDSNLYFGQLFMWIAANNDQILLPWSQASDFEECLHRLQLDLILICVNFSCILGGGRRSPAVACWASDHWVASSNPLSGKFRH